MTRQDCSSSSAYHGTAFIKHDKIYLPLLHASSIVGGDATRAGSCAPANPASAGASSSAGSAGGGPLAYGASWECEIIPGLSVP